MAGSGLEVGNANDNHYFMHTYETFERMEVVVLGIGGGWRNSPLSIFG